MLSVRTSLGLSRSLSPARDIGSSRRRRPSSGVRPGLWIVLLLPFLFCSAESLRAADAPGAFSKNTRWGYKIRAPKGWTRAALSADEEWIASKNICMKEMRAPSSMGSWHVTVSAEMWVIGFPHVRQEQRGAKREGGKIRFRNPYRDYKSFLKQERWFVGGGYHFTKETETEVRGTKVSIYEIKIDKMVQAPMRMLTWVYHYDDIDFAIQFKILEKYYQDYRRGFHGCLKSFERIARTKALPGGGTTGAAEVVDVVSEKDLSPEERMRRRHEKVERTIGREIENLPPGWYSVRSKHYVALSNSDKKFTRRVLSHAEALRLYLDKRFGDLGSEYVPTGILRVFETVEEERAFSQTTRSFWSGATQVLVTKSHGARKDWEFEYLSKRVTSQWLAFKNLHLTASLPGPIYSGLLGHMGFARSKGSKVNFSPDAWDRDFLRRLIKEGNAHPIRNLFEGSSQIFSYQHNLQAGSVMQFLMTKASGKWRNIVGTYLKNVIEETIRAESEFQSSAKSRKKKKGDSEDDEDEGEDDDDEDEIEEIVQALKKKTQSIRQRAFERTFHKFSASDWKRLDKTWQEWVD